MAVKRCYPRDMAEVLLALLVVGVVFIADADRLQLALDRLRELMAWLAE